MNARRSLVRNTGFGLVGQLGPLAVGVATIPATIGAIGTERFGALTIAWAVLVYFGIFDLGLGRATTRSVARAVGDGREASVPGIVWTAVTFQCGLGLFGLAAMATLASPLASVLKSSPGVAVEAEQMFRVLALVVPLLLVSVCFRGVLEAGERFDLVATVRLPLNSSVYALTLIGASAGLGLPGIVSLLLIAYSVALVAYYLLARRVFPTLRRAPTWQPGNLGPLLRFGGWATVSMVLGPLLLSMDRILIGVLLSVSAVAFYAAPYEAVYRFVVIPGSLGAALFPTVSVLHAQRDGPSIRDLLLRSMEIVTLLLGPVLVAIIALAPDLLYLWLGSAFAERSTAALRLLCLAPIVQ